MVVNGKGQSKVPSRKTIAEAIQSYLREVHTLRRQRSMERDKWLLDLFASVIGKTYMNEVSRDTLFFSMAYLKNADKSPKTIRCRLSTIETFLKKQGFPKLLLQGDLPRVTKKLAKDCYTEAPIYRSSLPVEFPRAPTSPTTTNVRSGRNFKSTNHPPPFKNLKQRS